ncbi:o-succinylbenzoate--CoA ligase [Erwinia endophytica]|uniref:o-succinylbenzoate--CoA ligase n=1 Tax=Erwinia endophytica TaxID=1563158 RepID=UPI001265FC09|nr:o-succinylbenzoate--CoA ligase [Erwinia endophytica]KAB8312240.1 o-succinylbenzoate--CoA ligase [Erwinia endophytica]
MAALSDWPWRHWARIRPEQIAMVVEGRHLSWAQLAQRVEEMAMGFISQGVHAGSGVAIKAANSELTVLAYLALLLCGTRLLPLNPQFPPSQLAALLPWLDIDFALTLSGEPLPDIAALTWQSQAGRVEHNWEPAALATLTLTSGSVGQPKAAAHTFRAHLASAHGVVTEMNFTAEARWLLSLPMCHVSGQGIIWRWLAVGACLVLPGSAPLFQALELATFASLVPTQLWRLLQQPRFPRNLQKVLLGGAVIPPALTQQAEEAGIACWCGYGMTETASTVTAKRADSRGGVGLPLAGQTIRVVDGEVQIQSDALACGYWRQGQLLPLTGHDGWFATRDGGYFDEDGLHLVGRLDNQFFSAGEGIQPEQLEAVLLAHPGVEQLFIVPKEDQEFGHRPVALVKLKAGATLAELEAWSKTRLAGFQRPVRWYVLPDLHHGGIKVSRQQLAAWVAKQEQGLNAQ